VLGELGACNWVDQNASVTGGTHGVCAFGAANATAGDVGFCTVECDTVNDCPDKTDPAPLCDVSQQTAISAGQRITGTSVTGCYPQKMGSARLSR
jgi:hypothetical protein